MTEIDILKQALNRMVSLEKKPERIVHILRLILQTEHPGQIIIDTWGREYQTDTWNFNDTISFDISEFVNNLTQLDLIDNWQDLAETKLFLKSQVEAVDKPIQVVELEPDSVLNEADVPTLLNNFASNVNEINVFPGGSTDQNINIAQENFEFEMSEGTDVQDGESGDGISIKLLKKRLIEEVIVNDNFEYPIEILFEIIDDSKTLNNFVLALSQRQALERKEKAGIIHRSEYTVELAKINDSLLYYIDKLSDLELIGDWKGSDLLEPLLNYANRTQPIGDAGETFKEVSIHLVEIEMPTAKEKKGIPVEEIKIHKFRQWMIKSQDEIGAGDYSRAYEYADKASKIITYLPQVYEFLMISFFRKEGAKSIINSALNGEDFAFKRLGVYAQKLKLLGDVSSKISKPSQKKKLTTYLSSLQEVSYVLLSELKKQYVSIRGDYINEIIRDKESARIKVINIFELAQRIYDISPSMFFLNVLQVELAGAGKLDWMRVDKNFNLVNKTSFDAIKCWTFLEKVQNQALSLQGKELEGKRNADKIYFPLIKKYSAIRYNRSESDTVKNNKRKKIIKIIDAWKVAFKIFNDNRFVHKAIRELEGDEKFEWLILDDEGKLDQHFACTKLGDDFDPVFEWTLMKEQLLGGNTPESIKKLEGAIAEDKSKGADLIYERIKEIRQTKLVISQTEEKEDRLAILRCIRNWRIYYIHTSQAPLTEKCINELNGNGIFQWFEIAKSGEIKSIFPNLNPTPLYELRKLFEIQGLDPELAVRDFIATNTYNKIVKTYNEFDENDIQENPEHLIGLLQKARQCYLLSNKKEYLKFIFEELSSTLRFKWFRQTYILDRHVILSAPECLKCRFDPISEMENLQSELEIN